MGSTIYNGNGLNTHPEVDTVNIVIRKSDSLVTRAVAVVNAQYVEPSGGGGGRTLRAQNINNMAALGEYFFTGDDLDCILDVIDEDFAEESEECNAELDELLSDISCDSTFVDISCNQCDKVCKTKRGLSRHTAYGLLVSMFDFHRSDRGSNPGRGGKIS